MDAEKTAGVPPPRSSGHFGQREGDPRKPRATALLPAVPTELEQRSSILRSILTAAQRGQRVKPSPDSYTSR